MKTRHVVVVALAAVLLAGCAHGGRLISTVPSERTSRAIPAMVRLTNHNGATIDVYAFSRGQSTRLGQVETGGTAVFALPAAVRAATDLELRVELVGTEYAYETGPMLINPGQVIQLTIENQLEVSSFAVQ